MNTPQFLLMPKSYFFMISPICRLTVDEQMVLDLVIMARPALYVACMKLSFLYKYKKKKKNFNKDIDDY